MSFLSKTMERARSWLSRDVPAPDKCKDAIRHTLFDGRIYQEMLAEAPALQQLVKDLNRKYDYTEDLVQDVLMQFFQSAPQLRAASEMRDGWLANHAVATNVSQEPETAVVRSYSKHNKYSATMATIAVGQKVRTYLEENKRIQEKAKEAAEAAKEAAEAKAEAEAQVEAGEACEQGLEQAEQSAEQAAADAADATGAAASAMGDFDGNGPLTEAQAQAAGHAQAAASTATVADAALAAAAQDAQTVMEAIEAALAAAEAAQQVADGAAQAVQDAAAQARQATRQPIQEAIRATAEALEKETEMFRGWGYSEGQVEQMSFEERADLARRLAGNRLAKFVKQLGRWRTMASAQRAKKVTSARDEVYDVELSGNLPDVLATEYPHLATEPGRLDFLVRLGEGRLLSKKYRGVEKIGKGAIICLVDTSSSMTTADRHGITREVWAKGFALAMLDQARSEKRDFVGILFANATKQRVFHFPGGHGPIEDVLAFTETFLSGGTNFEVPLDMAIEILERQFSAEHKAKGDLVFITDDDCEVGPAWLATYQAAKAKLGFRTFGVAVGMPKPGSALVSLSDDVRAVQEFADPSVVADVVRAV